MEDIELGRVPSDPSIVRTDPEEGPHALDQVFSNAEFVCCVNNVEKGITDSDVANRTADPSKLGSDASVTGVADVNEQPILLTESPSDHPPSLKHLPTECEPSNLSEAFEMKVDYDDDSVPATRKKGKQMAVRALSSLSSPLSMTASASPRPKWSSISRSLTVRTDRKNRGSNFPTPEVDFERESVPDDEPFDNESQLNGSRAGSVAFPGATIPVKQDADITQPHDVAELDLSAMQQQPPDDKVESSAKAGMLSFWLPSTAPVETKGNLAPVDLQRDDSTKNAVEMEAYFEGDEDTSMQAKGMADSAKLGSDAPLKGVEDANEQLILMTEDPSDHFEEPPSLKKLPTACEPSNLSEAFEMKMDDDDDSLPAPKKKGIQMAVRALSSLSSPLTMTASASLRPKWSSISRSFTARADRKNRGSNFPTPEVDFERESQTFDNESQLNGSCAGSAAVSRASTVVVDNKTSFQGSDLDLGRVPSDRKETPVSKLMALTRSFPGAKIPVKQDVDITQPDDVAELDLSAIQQQPPDDNVASSTKAGILSFWLPLAAPVEAKGTLAPVDLQREASTKNAVEMEAHFEGDEDSSASDDAKNTMMHDPEMVGVFLDEDDADQMMNTVEKGTRQAKNRLLYLVILVLVISIAVLAGVLARSNRSESNSSSSFLAGEGSDNTSATTPPAASAATSAPIGGGAGTAAPTAAPTECVNSIAVDAKCYRYLRDEITASFTICNQTSQDWVGLYRANSEMDNFPYPDNRQWQYSCGDQTCAEAIFSDSISMGLDAPPGRYRAFLFSNAGGDHGPPYFGIAASGVFRITSDGCA
jgi:hypothetical protein